MALRPTTPEVRLARMSGQAVADGGFDKAILPVGATEYHGPHLPYGTDTIGAEALAEGIARELGKTIVLPALDYGVSFHHIDFPWTLSLRPETLSLMIRDIIESVMAHRIRKIAILTAHDGNPPPAESAARSLYQDHGIEIAMIGGWQGAARRALEGSWDIDLDHAGQSEMSLVLYGAPETTRIDLAVNQPNQQLGQPVSVVGNFRGTVPKGYSGRAADGSAEEGEAIVKAIAGSVVPFLRELDAHDWKRGGWLSGIGS
ncbi:MAG: creatininase family protein [Nitrolancea sp.]